jgi:hypothetical protein
VIAFSSQPNGARNGFWKLVSSSIGRNRNAGHRATRMFGGSA